MTAIPISEELTQAVGGRDGKVGIDEGPKRTVHGLDSTRATG